MAKHLTEVRACLISRSFAGVHVRHVALTDETASQDACTYVQMWSTIRDTVSIYVRDSASATLLHNLEHTSIIK